MRRGAGLDLLAVVRNVPDCPRVALANDLGANLRRDVCPTTRATASFSRCLKPVRDGQRPPRGTKAWWPRFLPTQSSTAEARTYVSAVPGPSPDVRCGRNRARPVAGRVR